MSIGTDVRAAGNTAWRDFATDGLPSTGENRPAKSEIRAFVAAVSSAIATLDASIIDVATSSLASGVTYWRSTSDLLPAGTTYALGFVRLGTDAGLWARDTSGVWSNTNLVFPSLIAADIADNTSAIAAEVAARISAVAETNGRVDVLDTGLTAATAAIGDLTTGLGETNGRVDVLDTGLTAATAAIGDLTTGLGETNGRVDVLDTGLTAATAAIGDLTTAVSAEAAARISSDALIAGADTGRPGDGLTGLITTGSVASALSGAVPGSWEASDVALGAVVEVTGARVPADPGYLDLAPVARQALEVGRIYRITWSLRQTVDAIDPAGDTVRRWIQWCDYAKAGLSATTVLDDTPTISSGVSTIERVVSGSSGPGVDIVWPPSARYVVPVVRRYGTTGTTRVAVMRVEDITDAHQSEIDLASETARAMASEGDLSARIMDEVSAREEIYDIADVPGYAFALVQTDGAGSRRMTDLAIRASDGQFADWVITRLAGRVDGILGTAAIATALSAETARATSAEGALADEIADEASARQAIVRNADAPGYAVAMLDADGREVFGSSRASDGAPTDHCRTLMASRLEEDGQLPSLIDVPGYAFALVQTDGAGSRRMTDLAIRASDGQFADWVIARLAGRLESHLGTSSRPGLNGLWAHPSGDSVPWECDRRTIVGLGSSSTARSAAAYTAMATDIGVSYASLGCEGANISQLAAWVGAVTLQITVSGGSIPSSGAVAVTVSGATTNSSWPPMTGLLAGVHGSLAWSSGLSAIAFTRSASGAAVAASGAIPFTSDAEQYRDKVFVFEVGKNDLNQGRSAPDIVSDIVSLAEYMAPYMPCIIVMGHYVNASYDAAMKLKVSDINTNLSSYFGDRFIDPMEYFTGSQIWVDLAAEGYAPTSDDLADQANGYVPRGLMISDGQHLTTAMYGWRAKYLTRPALVEHIYR